MVVIVFYCSNCIISNNWMVVISVLDTAGFHKQVDISSGQVDF